MFKLLFSILFFTRILFSESVNTNLVEPKDVESFHIVTSKVRCICLPSLPIKSCSFNNCPISAQLKLFIENRILHKESPDLIIEKLRTGYGESINSDERIQEFIKNGNMNLVEGIVYGFGDKILAEPDSTWINITIIIISIFSILGILFYIKSHSKKENKIESEQTLKEDVSKYLKEL